MKDLDELIAGLVLLGCALVILTGQQPTALPEPCSADPFADFIASLDLSGLKP